MITVNIGRTFLKAYNKKYGKEYSAKEFFEREYFEVFYNHNKFMQWIQNSPFDQLQKQKKHFSEIERRKKLSELTNNIERGIINGSTAFGFPASMEKGFATTSGLVTDTNRNISPEEAFLSWIGSGMGIGVEGGFSFYFDNEDILMNIYEGWSLYRSFLNDKAIEKLGERQIDTWNGQWLYYKYYRNRNSIPDFGSFTEAFEYDKTKGELRAVTIKWSKLLFSLSKKFGDTTIIGFIGTFGNTNKTLGFYPFRIEQARKLILFYKKLFGENSILTDAPKYEEIFGLKLYKACQLGAIGLQALQPENLFDDIEKEKKLNLIYYRTYKIWLLAMINKEDTLKLTSEISKILHFYKDGSKGTDRKSVVEKNLLQSGKRNFLNYWEEIVIALPEKKQYLKEVSDRVFYMTTEEYGYFIALLRLEYRYQEK